VLIKIGEGPLFSHLYIGAAKVARLLITSNM